MFVVCLFDFCHFRLLATVTVSSFTLVWNQNKKKKEEDEKEEKNIWISVSQLTRNFSFRQIINIIRVCRIYRRQKIGFASSLSLACRLFLCFVHSQSSQSHCDSLAIWLKTKLPAKLASFVIARFVLNMLDTNEITIKINYYDYDRVLCPKLPHDAALVVLNRCLHRTFTETCERKQAK